MRIEMRILVGRIRIIMPKIIEIAIENFLIDAIGRRQKNKRIEMNIKDAECESTESKVE